ncbi:hypothetical protein B484DRAFT_411031 [Ochromonadaceae sp. CCMP2298]|nr:hypothetical protein B484DRAFT_411031 [Ochromonadaceae sp. CCMP2298]
MARVSALTERKAEILKTLGEPCSAVPPGAAGTRREDAAGGVDGQLEARKVELEPSALFSRCSNALLHAVRRSPRRQ